MEKAACTTVLQAWGRCTHRGVLHPPTQKTMHSTLHTQPWLVPASSKPNKSVNKTLKIVLYSTVVLTLWYFASLAKLPPVYVYFQSNLIWIPESSDAPFRHACVLRIAFNVNPFVDGNWTKLSIRQEYIHQNFQHRVLFCFAAMALKPSKIWPKSIFYQW